MDCGGNNYFMCNYENKNDDRRVLTQRNAARYGKEETVKIPAYYQMIGVNAFQSNIKMKNLYIIEDYNGRNWYEHKQIPIQAAAEATVYWAKTEKRTTCYAWPISIQCLCIENAWYLNPYWLFEYQKT